MSRIACLLFIFLIEAHWLHGDEPRSCKVQFVGEDDKPLAGAGFFFFEHRNGAFEKARFRNHELDESGRVTLNAVPMEFTIGVDSQDHFYNHFWTHREQPLAAEQVRIRVERSGSISFEFSHIDQEINSRDVSPVMLCIRTDEDAKRTGESIGIFPREFAPFRVNGLAPGIYRCELRHPFDSGLTYWSRSGIEVRKGVVTELKKLGALDVR